jgi:chromosome segregation ATPase
MADNPPGSESGTDSGPGPGADAVPPTVTANGVDSVPAAEPPPEEAKPEVDAKPAGKRKGKGKGKAKSGGKRGNKAILDGLKAQIADQTKQKAQLDAQVQDITTGDAQAVQDMNAYQLEHNELVREFQIAQQEVQDLETILTNKEREIEEIREVSGAELKVYQRKVKHLMAANQNQFSQAYYKNEQELFLERQQQQLEAADPERTANALRSDSNNLQLENETLMTNHRMKQDRLFTELREEFERQVDARRAEHDQRIRAMRAQLEEQRLRETQEVEQRKNDHIKQLQASNAKAFDRIQHYFSGITHNNLDVIKQNKAKISARKVAMNTIRKAVDELNVKRRKLEEPLKALIAENIRLSKEIEVYKQDKRDLARNKAKIRKLEDELRDLQLSEEVMEQRFQQLEQERDALYDQFESSIHDVRQKTEFRAFVLEQKVKRLHEEVEQKEMQLQDIMQRAGLDPTSISAKIEDVLAVKNARINQLEVDLAKVQRAQNEILKVYEQKMLKFGIPREELGFSVAPSPVEFCVTGESK